MSVKKISVKTVSVDYFRRFEFYLKSLSNHMNIFTGINHWLRMKIGMYCIFDGVSHISCISSIMTMGGSI